MPGRPRSAPFPYTTLFRSPDAGGAEDTDAKLGVLQLAQLGIERHVLLQEFVQSASDIFAHDSCLDRIRMRTRPWRSEEHTSELQSHSDLVCRLLLERKNKQ